MDSREEIDSMKGKIRRLIRQRGFGFIKSEDGKDIFFHRSALEGKGFDTLQEGVRVEFEVRRTSKGLQAANVRVVTGLAQIARADRATHTQPAKDTRRH